MEAISSAELKGGNWLSEVGGFELKSIASSEVEVCFDLVSGVFVEVECKHIKLEVLITCMLSASQMKV